MSSSAHSGGRKEAFNLCLSSEWLSRC